MIELLVLIAIVAILAAVLFPVFAPTHREGRGVRCGANVRRLSTALQMYVMDHEGQFPPANAWHDGIATYLPNPTVWVCPSRKEQKPAYSFNALLHLRSLTTVYSPAEQPMLWESMIGRWNASDAGASFVAPHGQRGIVAFADGHVKPERKLPAPDAGLTEQRAERSSKENRLP